MQEKEVTESWLQKNYEKLMTEYYFSVVVRLKDASMLPAMENLKMAFFDVKSFCYSMVFSKHHLEQFKTIKKEIDEVEQLLYGNTNDPAVLRLRHEWGVIISTDRHGKTIVLNAQNVIKQMWEWLFLVKQWGYDQGFFAVKPHYAKIGVEAMQDAFSQ